MLRIYVEHATSEPTLVPDKDMVLPDVGIEEDVGLPDVDVEEDVVFHNVGSGERDRNVKDIVKESEGVNVEGEGADFDDDMDNITWVRGVMKK
ncbi:hypothetical protein CJ030_MR3G001302 [Morella rubra]|uniref:Uncharacterized protein n=1 Tax=Morella rubra TaxID=262757 RepID=A0A6A1W289_9ROSI|nr:hypothetical protein CJ030_MR3G001302 [Morella rubra]